MYFIKISKHFSELIPSSDGSINTVVPLFLGTAGASIEDVSFYNSEGLGAEFYEKTSSGYRFHVRAPIDIKMENLTTGQYFQKESDEIIYDMPLSLNAKTADYCELNSFNTNSTFPVKTMITEPQG